MSIASPADFDHLPSFTPSQILPRAESAELQSSEAPSRRTKLNSPTPGLDNNRLNHVPGPPLHTLAEASHPNLLRPDALDGTYDSSTHSPQRPYARAMSVSESDLSQPSAFNDSANDQSYGLREDHFTQPTTTGATSGDDVPSYDLKPPPPALAISNIELLAERLWSVDHLKIILRDGASASRFTSFLTKYKPESSQLLARYVEIQKAVAAVEYANAIAGSISRGTAVAAHVDHGFEGRASGAVEQLLNDALPGYITHRLVQLVTETLVKEITGQGTPVMRELVNGLAEVYCLSDPSLPDNPIVYASEEFYKCTQYGKEFSIGRNCRFLQGPRTSGACVQRLITALNEGQEICELILNYRRDGSPFLNLLMIAPLYDNKGTVRYFIGAQIDVNGLVQDGKGLDSFQSLLCEDKASQRYGGAPAKTANVLLSEMSGMWNREEQDIAARYGRARSNSGPQPAPKGNGRRIIGMDDPQDQNLWPSPHLGPSGRLPGVFQNYLLVRPYPSLRITFTSPALRIPGLLQSKLLDRIGGPPHIRDGILSALSSGIGVTAKVTWLGAPAQDKSGSFPTQHAGDPLASTSGSQASRPGSRSGPGQRSAPNTSEGKPRWLHCTPLLGSDDRCGVWVVIIVASESITGALNAHERAAEANAAASASIHSSVHGTPREPQQQHTHPLQAGVTSPTPRYALENPNSNPNRGKSIGPSSGSQRRHDPYSSTTDRDSDHRLYHEYLIQSERNSAVHPPLPSIPAEHQQHQNQNQNQTQQQQQYSHLQQRTGSRATSSNRGSGVSASGGTGAGGGKERETHEAKAARARMLAERAMIGEDTFRDF